MLSNLSDIGSYHLLKIEQLKENKKWASSHYLYFPHCLTMLHKMNGNARLNTTINQIRWDITPSKKNWNQTFQQFVPPTENVLVNYKVS